MNNKRSFFEKLTGTHKEDSDKGEILPLNNKNFMDEVEEEIEEAELTMDVYQTPTEIIIQSFVAGLRPDDLDVTITHDMVTIKGKREDRRRVERENYFYQELYWGTFSRSLLLPQEVDPDEAEAGIKDGMLTIKLPKLDKDKVQKLKIKGE
jgi:HSP20 family protein